MNRPRQSGLAGGARGRGVDVPQTAGRSRIWASRSSGKVQVPLCCAVGARPRPPPAGIISTLASGRSAVD